MSEQNYLISICGADARESSAFADQLRAALEGAAPDVTVERKPDRPGTQDMGSVLAVIFGTPAVVAIAQGIAAFLRRRQSASLTIKTAQGEVVLTNVTHETALAALREVLGGGAGGGAK